MSEVTSSDNPKCKHYNVGYCRYKDDCKFKHPKEDCESKNCSFRKCPKRHRRNCWYGEKCKRREGCEFIHNKKCNCIISNLKAQVESLKGTIVELNVKIGNLEKELQTKKNQTSEINVVASEEFKCDMCGVIYKKKEATLKKHINTKHQLDPAEVDTNIQNDFN